MPVHFDVKMHACNATCAGWQVCRSTLSITRCWSLGGSRKKLQSDDVMKSSHDPMLIYKSAQTDTSNII